MTFNLYCIKECPVGKKKSNSLLSECESSWDAASDMREFTLKCQCPYKEEKENYNERKSNLNR